MCLGQKLENLRLTVAYDVGRTKVTAKKTPPSLAVQFVVHMKIKEPE
jgi:hypothetical protein